MLLELLTYGQCLIPQLKLSIHGMTITGHQWGIKLICKSSEDGDQQLIPGFTIQKFWLLSSGIFKWL